MSTVLSQPGFYATYAVIQVVVVLLLLRSLDLYKRGSLGLLVALALWGATGAAMLALAGNEAIQSLLSPQTRLVFGDAISAPVVEELAKGLALVLAVLGSTWVGRRLGVSPFDGLSDGILYGAAVGLGFGFTEDFFYFLNDAGQQGLAAAQDLFLSRRDFLGLGGLQHALFTAAFGAGIGLSTWSRGWRGKIGFPLLGLAAAVAMHALNNGLVELVLTIQYGQDTAAAWVSGTPVSAAVDSTADSAAWVIDILNYAYLAAFLVAGVLWVRYQRRVIRTELEDEATGGLISLDEWHTSFELRRKAALYWRLLHSGNLERLKEAHQLYAHLGQLAYLKWRIGRFGGDLVHIKRARARVISTQALAPQSLTLPSPPTSLIGRDAEVRELLALLEDRDVRALTLAGPGGVGKTRLALRLAAELSDDFASGVCFVDLTPVADRELAASEIARGLGLAEAGGRPLIERLTAYLADKQLLLVLDNCEQLPEAGELAWELLRAAPRVTIIATSRLPLRIAAERVFTVPALELPASADLESVERAQATSLFAERATGVNPEFRLTGDNAAAVVEICRRLDGIPLAIELAAARSNVLGAGEIAERLGDRLQLLTSERSDLPAHQRTLRATLDWSYELLEPGERRLFARLAVFSEGWDIEAAEAVCGVAAEDGSTLDLLGSLTDQNLVVARAQEAGGRMYMLNTVRDYAAERLDSEERAVLRLLHAEHYLAVAEAGATAERSAWLRRIGADRDNLRAASDLLVEMQRLEEAARLAVALEPFWERGPIAEGRSRLRAVLLYEGRLSADVRPRAIYAAGRLALLQSDYDEAVGLLQRAIPLFEELGDGGGMIDSLWDLAWCTLVLGRYAEAERRFRDALDLARELGEPDRIARGAGGLGRALAEQGQFDSARLLLDETLYLRRSLGDESAVASALSTLARLAVMEEDPDRANRLSREAVELARGLEDKLRIAEALYPCALAAVEAGDHPAAVELFEERLALCRDLGDQLGVAECLEGLALCEQDPEAAARLLSEAGAIRGELGVAPWTIDRERHERLNGRSGASPPSSDQMTPHWPTKEDR